MGMYVPNHKLKNCIKNPIKSLLGIQSGVVTAPSLFLTIMYTKNYRCMCVLNVYFI